MAETDRGSEEQLIPWAFWPLRRMAVDIGGGTGMLVAWYVAGHYYLAAGYDPTYIGFCAGPWAMFGSIPGLVLGTLVARCLPRTDPRARGASGLVGWAGMAAMGVGFLGGGLLGVLWGALRGYDVWYVDLFPALSSGIMLAVPAGGVALILATVVAGVIAAKTARERPGGFPRLWDLLGGKQTPSVPTMRRPPV